MKKMLYCTVILSFLSACAPSRYPSTGYDGTWVLFKQSGGFAGRTTPADKESLLVIGKGVMKQYENGTLVSEGVFEVEKSKVIHSTEPQDVIVSDKITKQSIAVAGDTLTLTDQCYDCYSYQYIKKR